MNEEEFRCDLPLPPSANHLWRFVPRLGHPVKARAYLNWLADGMAVIMLEATSGRNRVVLPYPENASLHVDVQVRCRNRRRDLDNFAKPLLDLLQAGGVIANDRCVDRLTMLRCAVEEGEDEHVRLAIGREAW